MPKKFTTHLTNKEPAMFYSKIGKALVIIASLGFTTHSAVAEELSVATFVPPNHETVTVALAWFEKEINERSDGYNRYVRRSKL